jgi:hypothetical protein
VVPDDNEEVIMESSDECIVEPTITSEDAAVEKKRRRYCCACEVTSLNNPNAIFTYVPYTQQRPLETRDDNDVRKQYWKRIFQRKEYLRRLRKLKSDNRRSLVHCDKHELELVMIKFSWINKDGVTGYDNEEMKLPIDINDPPRRTRLQRSLRKEPPIKKNRNPKHRIFRYQKQNEIS